MKEKFVFAPALGLNNLVVYAKLASGSWSHTIGDYECKPEDGSLPPPSPPSS